ncbi:uncharacterized protein LOC132618735 isoform X2 [Lycium barbarum]|nr:uncharacterized protein LOC132618735 isoform X2 [Lycium barbarum]
MSVRLEKYLELQRKYLEDLNGYHEAVEKLEELKLLLVRVVGALKDIDSQNVKLKDELSLTKAKLEETEKKFEGLELDHKKLQQQSAEAKNRYNTELKALEEALQAHELNSKEHVKVKEAFDRLSLEFESSKKKMGELEQELEEALTTRASELSKVQGELEISKSQVQDIEKKLASKEALIDELSQELDMRKASESQVKEDILALELLLSSSKEDLRAKLSELEDIKLKLQEEVGLKEDIEAKLKSQETQLSVSQEELAKLSTEKGALEAAVAELNNNVVQMKELCSDLEVKLQLSEDKFWNADSLLSQALAKSSELEQKLEEQISTLEKKCVAAEAESKKHSDRVSELEGVVEELKGKCTEFKKEKEALTQENSELKGKVASIGSKLDDLEAKMSAISAQKNEAVEELKSSNQVIDNLKEQLNSEGQALQLQDIGGSSSDRKDDVEVKSRDTDIGQMLSTPTKRNSKKKSEVSSTQPSSSESQVQHVERSAAIPLKFILGVALVSVILGIILGIREYSAHK